MERRLIVMRHAKSSWNTDAANDHARPLNKRGRRDAPAIARRLVELEWIPDLVASSDSQRTRETWARMGPEFDEVVEARFTPTLYHGGLGALQEEAENWPDHAHCILALGHNPGWERAVAALSSQWITMTTANAALLLGEGETWPEAMESPWTLEGLLRPRELG